MAFLLSTHMDAHTLSNVDMSEVHGALMHFADAAAATAKDAVAGAVPEEAAKEEGKGVFDLLVAGVQTCLVTLHSVFKAANLPGAWGWAIMTFTVFVKAITYPLNYKQMASTISMQKLQPKLKAIQARYKDDPAKQNEMTAQLYKDEEVNPLAGCIPALIQLPIFIALYRGLLQLAQEDKLQESFLWIPSLEGPVGKYNPVTQLPEDSLGWLTKWVDGAPPLGWEATLAYLSLPVILVVLQSTSQKLLQPPQSDDPAQQQTQAILKFLPLMIGWFALNVPAGLGVYWVINTGLSTLQQWFIRQQFADDMPVAAGAGGETMSFKDEVRAAPKSMEAPKAFTPTKTAVPKGTDPRFPPLEEAPPPAKSSPPSSDGGASEAPQAKGGDSKTSKKKQAKAKARGKKKKN